MLQVTSSITDIVSVSKHKVEQVRLGGMYISISSCPVFCLFLQKATKISTVTFWAKSSKEVYQESNCAEPFSNFHKQDK